ncbi:MAG: hypothetical protein ACUVUC_14315 [Thermoguttaceae bacterium]
MANEVLIRQGVSKVWAGAGTRDYDLTLAGLADGAARQGQKGDLADANGRFPGRWAVCVELNMDAAPTAGQVIEIYWAASHDNSTFPGGVSGSDAAYKPGEEDEWKKQLMLIGCLVLTADADEVVQTQVFEFAPPARYGAPVVVNKSGQALEGDNAAHKITLTALVDEIQ